MKSIKYFIQFLIISTFLLIFKILGLNFASYLSGKIISFIGPLFRSKNLIKLNILKAFPDLSPIEVKKITKKMWNNYGKILAEYIFIKDFRLSKSKINIYIWRHEIFDIIRLRNELVRFK